jgi:hypothetical protein
MLFVPARLRILLVAISLLAHAPAAEYAVDAIWGLDSNPGTAAAPWRTLTHACAQPLLPGDALRIRGVFAAPAERFPLRIPPGVAITPLSPFGTALIDAGSAAGSVFDRAGLYDQTIGVSRFSYGLITIVGAPALELRTSDRTAVLRPLFEGLRIAGDVLLCNESSQPFTSGDFYPRFDRCEIDGVVELRTSASANGARESFLSAAFADCTLHDALRASGLESPTTFELVRCRLERGAAIANDASDG